MSLPAAWGNSHNKHMKGFTLIELLLVIGGIGIIAALTIPVGVNFYRIQVLDETAGDILVALRRAQSQAMFQKNDSAFGVRFLSDSYVLFEGNSYGEVPSQDEPFNLMGGITTSGIVEVDFAKLTGIPNTTGTLTITSGNDSQGIHINAQGKVEKN